MSVGQKLRAPVRPFAARRSWVAAPLGHAALARWFSVVTLAAALASPGAARAADCPTLDARRLVAARAAYAELFPDVGQATRSVHGVSLTGDARALGFLDTALGKRPNPAWARAASCKDLLCALRETLGSDEAALWFLVLAGQGGAVASLDASAGDALWTAGDLRLLAHSALELPEALRQLPTLKAFRKLAPGQLIGPQSPAAPGGGKFWNAFSNTSDAELGFAGTIQLRETVWTMPERDRRAVLWHELGHHYDYSRAAIEAAPPSVQPEWLALTGWTRSGASFALPASAELATAGESLPGEDFADSIANFRFQPRLLRAYSAKKYEAIRERMGGEFQLTRDAALEKAWATLGGPLESLRGCAAKVQRASFSEHQGQLFIVRPSDSGGTRWQSVARSSFVVRGGCEEEVLAALERTPALAAASCSEDPEEVAVEVADELEDVWGSFAEAAEKIRAAAPPAALCLGTRSLSQSCFAGDAGARAAEVEAHRILRERAAPDAAAPALAKTLLTLTPVAPTDEDLLRRYPALGSPEELLAACLLGAVEVSTEPGKQNWMYWVKEPPAGSLRGFDNPLWNAACHRDFLAALSARGLKLVAGDPLFEHLVYQAKNKAGLLVETFTNDVLHAWPLLRSACGVPAATKPAAAGKSTCAAAWLKERLAPLLPADKVDAVAAHLAEQLRGP